MLKLGQLLGSVKGWVYVATTLIPTAWTFLAGQLEGLPLSEVVPLVTCALAGGALLGFALLRGYEVVAGWYGARKEAARLADELQALLDVGQQEILVDHAAHLWAGRDATSYRWLVHLRRLKQAADFGMIAYTGAVAGHASKNSMASLTDLVKFFRERRFEQLPPLPPQPRSTTRPIKSVELARRP